MEAVALVGQLTLYLRMAQYLNKMPWFEAHWRPRLALASKVLQRIEDRWLLSDEAFPCKSTLAIILNTFALDFHTASFINYRGIRPDDLKRRSLDEWLAAVASPEVECSRLAPKRSDDECHDLVGSLCTILAQAAESWASKSPLQPPCEQVIREIIDVLASERFVTIHYD